MSKVLVLGATGIIGFPIARKFVAEGYRVYGLTTSESKVNLLLKHEIIPIVGKAQDASVWESHARNCDIIIESIADHQDYTVGATVASVLINILKEHPNKIVIYTSGVWVLGTCKNGEIKSETEVAPPKLVESRPALEKRYTDAGAIVFRPGMIIGATGLFGMLFKSATEQGKLNLASNHNGKHYWSTVHYDDVATGYLLAVKRIFGARGQIFNLTAQSERADDCAEAIANLCGRKCEISFFVPEDPLNFCLGMNQHLSSQKARDLLGWSPKKLSFVDNAGVYYGSWKAGNAITHPK